MSDDRSIYLENYLIIRAQRHAIDMIENPEMHKMTKNEYTREEIAELCKCCSEDYAKNYVIDYARNIAVKRKMSDE